MHTRNHLTRSHNHAYRYTLYTTMHTGTPSTLHNYAYRYTLYKCMPCIQVHPLHNYAYRYTLYKCIQVHPLHYKDGLQESAHLYSHAYDNLVILRLATTACPGLTLYHLPSELAVTTP